MNKQKEKFDLNKDLTDSIKIFDIWVKNSFFFLKGLWKESKKKFFILLLILALLYAGASVFASWMWGRNTEPAVERVGLERIQKVSDGVGSEASEGLKLNVQANFVFIQGIVDIFAPILDGFVSSTPDTAGMIDDKIKFSFGSMKSAKEYSNNLLEVSFPFIVILLSFQVVQLLIQARGERAKEELSSLISRLLTVVIMLIFTPYILSYSIALINALNRYILGADSISSYLTNYFNDIKADYNIENGVFGILKGSFDNLLNSFNPVQGLVDTFQLILILAPIYLSLLIFLFIIFQFVIRFLKLYFLSVVYPFVVIFYLNKGSQIPSNFWKEWTTSLIHQAGFVMGHKILNDLALNVLNTGGVGIEQILIYIGGLLFLLSINVITGQLWGNAFSAVSDSFMAKGLSSLISSPFSAAAGAVAGFGTGALGVPTRNSISGFAGAKAREGLMGRVKTNHYGFPERSGSGGKASSAAGSAFKELKQAGENIELKNPVKSKAAQRMSENGYSVTGVDQKEGVIGVSGKWQAYDNPESGLTTLYETKEEAISDGVKDKSKLYEVEGKYNMLDTVNYQGMQNYSDRTQTKILLDNTPNKRASEVLNQAKESNLEKGIDGITTSQYPRETMEKYKGQPPEDTSRIQKSFVYTDKIQEKRATIADSS